MTDLDQALVRFQLGAPEYGPGLANHGPMAAEALVQLGHEALLPGLVDVYAPRLPVCPGGAPIADAQRDAALGDAGRVGDWIATFRAELAQGDWSAKLREWLPSLLPGVFASATHGLLRVAHAVRALEEVDTPARRGELIHGLALWSARFQRLPGEVGSAPEAGSGPAAVLAALVPLPFERRRPGLFFDAVRVLDDEPQFAAAVARVDLDALPHDEWIGQLCRAGARLYLANPGARIGYAHCVTAPAALRLLAPHLPAEAARHARAAVFHAVAALHAVSAGTPDRSDERAREAEGDRERLSGDWAELRYRAACSLREHAIKLTEACRREDEREPDPDLRLAAADAALVLEGPGSANLC